MSRAKKSIGWMLPFVVLFVAITLMPGMSLAAISYSGSLYPYTDPSTWTSDSRAYIGLTAAGMITVDNSSTPSTLNSRFCRLGNPPNAGTVTIDGAGSTWNNALEMLIGDATPTASGTGTLFITNGGYVSVGSTTIVSVIGGKPAGGTSTTMGKGTIDFGANGGTLSTKSLYSASADLMGTGTIVTRGLVMDTNLTIDSAASMIKNFSIVDTGKNIAVALDMSDATNVGDLGVGYQGNGTLAIRNGITVVFDQGQLGYGVGGTGTAVVDTGSKWQSNAIYVGRSGQGSLLIANGGVVELRADAGSMGCSIAHAKGSSGAVTVDGSGGASKLICRGQISVASAGTGTLNITNGGVVLTTGHQNSIGVYGGTETLPAGTATVDGAGSEWVTAGSLSVGIGGVLRIRNGGFVSVNEVVSTDYTPSGSSLTAGSGTINFANGTLQARTLVTAPSQLTGTGTINARGLVSDYSLTFDSPTSASQTIGINQSVIVNVDVSSSANAGDLGMGYLGTGSRLTIKNGAKVYTENGFFGQNVGAFGSATVEGAGTTWNTAHLLTIGKSGSGAVSITNGAGVTASRVEVGGNLSTSSSTLTVSDSGSTLVVTNPSHGGSLLVGANRIGGTGLLKIANNASVTIDYANISWVPPSTTPHGTVYFSGGTLSTTSLAAPLSCLTGAGTVYTRGLQSDFSMTFDAASGGKKTFTADGGATITLDLSSSAGAGDLGVGGRDAKIGRAHV